jgi:hypothetical protein
VKRLLRIFELSKNEQRVVLIVIFLLITVAFAQYERRVHRLSVQSATGVPTAPSPSVGEHEDQM